MDDLEEMMMIEAIKLSLEAEEERKKRVEKEAAKDAKKRAKEEKKREKKEKKGVYGSGASSAGGSTLSLSLSGFGRRRGNSGASNLGKEVTPEGVDESGSKGKEAGRGMAGSSAVPAPINTAQAESSTSQLNMLASQSPDNASFPNFLDSHDSPTTAAAPDKPSHLRQMSTASSLTSSFIESAPNSPQDNSPALGLSRSPNASGTDVLGSSSNAHEVGDTNTNTGFNLRSLAAVINVGNEDETNTATHSERPDLQPGDASTGPLSSMLTQGLGDSVAALTGHDSNSREHQTGTPELIITPGTPAAMNEAGEFGMQLGTGMSEGVERAITQ